MPTNIAKSLIGLVALLSGLASLAYVAIGWFTGETALIVGAIGPGFVSIVAMVFLRLAYDRILALLIITAVVIFTEDRLLGIEDVAHAAIVPLTIIGITGAFFVSRRFVVPYVGIFAVGVFLSRLHLFGVEAHYLQATIATGSLVFGAILMSWMRREFERREEQHRSLFQHAPVSLWSEDFSSVGVELQALMDGGVTNVDEYLTSNPEEVRRLASLVQITDVNDATVLLTEAPDRSLLLGRFSMDTFSRGALDSFVAQFLAIANDTEKVTTELKGGLTFTGHPIEALIVWSAPRVGGILDLSNVTVAMVDVTGQREAERKLQDLIRSKDQFVATISHELRTPLTAVVGIAEELRDSNGSISEVERQELLGLVADQGLEVSRIVEDLLIVARSDAGNLIINSQQVDLGTEARNVAQAIDPSITVETSGSPVVVADSQRVRQIIRNLITNAQRYGGSTIRVVVGDEGARGFLEVRDNGEPLALTSRTDIFEPYSRAEQRTGVTASVGLGLTVSRRLARHMGGDLIYVHDGDETIFLLTLATSDRAVTVR
ncbi:MAG: HAMP domain-containing sensor histidine kinase [Actinomycetota bacterium]|nr:HAMP domain-containing sensor histidine kinase [Actinomycetota bacterium]